MGFRTGYRLAAMATVLVLVLTGCVAPWLKEKEAVQPSAAQPAPAQATPAQQTVETQAPPRADWVGKMSLSPANGPAGAQVTVTGTGLPANTALDLVWNSVKGSFALKGDSNEEYHGQQYTPVSNVLEQVKTDAEGNVETTFTVPEDYGFIHDVTLMQDGVIRNQAAFSIDPVATMHPSRGPVGTQINLEFKGLGWQKMEGTWHVIYDNNYVGFISGVTTNGTARFMIPATGSPGKHIIQIMPNPWSTAYLRPANNPLPHLDDKVKKFEFIIEEGDPVLPPELAGQALPVQKAAVPAGSGLAIWTDLSVAYVDHPVKLQGRALPAGKTVEFTWSRIVGNRVTGSGWKENTVPLGTAPVKGDGTLELDFKVPDDLGGAHRIDAWVDGQAVTSTMLNITPFGNFIEPASGPVGTVFTVNVTGVGWTETSNIYLVNYDNSFIGYTCGFPAQGNVMVKLVATGEPGWHFIDFYPGIYRGVEPMDIDIFRIPQLTYAADHPNEDLPAFRFAFYITEN